MLRAHLTSFFHNFLCCLMVVLLLDILDLHPSLWLELLYCFSFCQMLSFTWWYLFHHQASEIAQVEEIAHNSEE